jgi:hypothetical protein
MCASFYFFVWLSQSYFLCFTVYVTVYHNLSLDAFFLCFCHCQSVTLSLLFFCAWIRVSLCVCFFVALCVSLSVYDSVCLFVSMFMSLCIYFFPWVSLSVSHTILTHMHTHTLRPVY